MLSFIYTLSSERGEDTALCFYLQSIYVQCSIYKNLSSFCFQRRKIKVVNSAPQMIEVANEQEFRKYKV